MVKNSNLFFLISYKNCFVSFFPLSFCIVILFIDTIYMAATSPMALFDAIGSVDSIKLSGLDASGWYIQSAADAINNGEMTFVGKYDVEI